MGTGLTVVVLAAGEGKRMRSRRPKVLHRLGGRPLIAYPVSLARRLGGRLVLVVGPDGEEVRQALGETTNVHFVEQKERLGTGHALLQARSACGNGAGTILVLPGDTPLLSEATLRRLVDSHRAGNAAATLLTAAVDDPAGYGRIVREGGRVTAIVEDRDASPQQREIREIGTSVYCFDARRLWAALDQVRADNDQGEYYLTDVIGILQRQGQPVVAVVTDDPTECLGINDRKQLARVAGLLRQRTLDRLMAEGVTILDPVTTYVDDTVSVGSDTVLAPGIVLEGDSDHLERALANLLQNAALYTPGQGRISLKVRRENTNAVLDVADTGIGMSAEDAEHAFDRFYRGAGAHAIRTDGFGLGLAIVKLVVDAHGGSVSVSSRLGQGTTFTVSLPLAKLQLRSTEDLVRGRAGL